jgi:hypothetical protein
MADLAKTVRGAEKAVAEKLGLMDMIKYQNTRPKELGVMGEHNGQADALRHMLGSAQMTQKYGPTLANIFTTGHEYLLYPFEPHGAAMDMDLHNNRIGRELAQKYKTQEEIEQAALELLRQAQQSGQYSKGAQGVPRWLMKSEENY